MPVNHSASERCKKELLERIHAGIADAVQLTVQNAPAGRSHPDHHLAADIIPEHQHSQALLVSAGDGIFCGKDWAEAVLEHVDTSVSVRWQVQDASPVSHGQQLATLEGPAAALLAAESALLHFIGVMSGIATQFQLCTQQLADSRTRFLDTLNTTPAITNAHKYALLCGDTQTQRLDFSDLIPINENHIIACGSIVKAMENARWIDPDRPVEVTVTSTEQLLQAIRAGADIILLHNFSPAAVSEAIAIRHQENAALLLVAGGQITPEQLTEFSNTGVDYIAANALINRPAPLEITLQFLPSAT